MFVCLFACLSSARTSGKNICQISRSFLYMLPMVVAWFSSDDTGIRYVLPVLWMTSCFHTTDRIGQNQRRCVCFVQFARWRHRRRSVLSPTTSCYFYSSFYFFILFSFNFSAVVPCRRQTGYPSTALQSISCRIVSH